MNTGKEIKPRRVTAKQVAEAAGVSRSAVSRAFTPGSPLDEDKKKKILQVSEQLGYRPNALAAGLQSRGRSNLVAIVTGDLVNHYDSEILAKLMRGLHAMGKWPVVLGGSAETSEAEVLEVLAYPLDALILRGGSVDESVAIHCAKLNIPLIVSGRVMDAEGVDCVCCDNARGAELAVARLIAQGKTRLGYLGGLAHLSSDQERKAGFENALTKAGLKPAAVKHSDFSYEGGYESLTEIMSSEVELDGLFCANDAMALGAIAAARQQFGMSIPSDLSVVGFDDIAIAQWPSFQLSTIRNDMDQTVSQILRLLTERLDQPEKPSETILIEPEFISRGTH
ncbi:MULTISPECIES: LacI family DNA-binding transcriptional regulator [unclassified Ruegeria]|uniref:LacI family DNA-binding transcriptional regulator n=1 Tax=unclassified Ruegeria TaxID=2625375 RepID=UPI001489158E|nr:MULTISPECIES: LacI family DNA-binding transcriptional regulator [unclassified Ruegeria]NOD88016.1 substrate-binding domain-containing protein [Ruegeria sp. HKCCD4318]NOE14864.1 substrate-binding domain-containing protein [Ruegeria sp. HKCCD4318-2]NOG11533.1 LacI family DNA-binding transcriptional regulator [Ruegeria sp. HKCCD4315]